MNGTITPVGQPKVEVKPTVKLNGTAPKVETPPAPAAAPPAVDYAAEQAKLKASLDELQKQTRRHAQERTKFSQEKGSLLKEVEELRKLKSSMEQFDLNPEAFLESRMGKDFYEKLTDRKVSGGAPPSAVVQTEIQKLKADFEAKLAERDKATETAQQTAAKQRVEATRKQLRAEASEFIQASGKEYGILSALGDSAGLASMLANKIESKYYETEKRDPSTGELLLPGRTLTTKEAADLVEQEVVALVEKVTATEKWKARSKPQPSGEPSQQRRVLTNSATGRTPGREPAISPEERQERAARAFREKAARNQSA